jgi:hypothetical protein
VKDQLSIQIDSFLRRSEDVKSLKLLSKSSISIAERIIKFSKRLFRAIWSLYSFFSIIKMYRKRRVSALFFSHSVTRYVRNSVEVNRFVYPFQCELPDYEIINLEDGLIERKIEKTVKYNEASIYAIISVVRLYLLIKRKINYLSFFFGWADKRMLGSSEVCTYATVYKAIIRLLRPEIVFTINWYGVRGLGLVMAARDLKVKVVDVQHGLAAAAKHRCYVNLSVVPERIRPDYFLSWTDKDADSINRELGRRAAFAVGSLSMYGHNGVVLAMPQEPKKHVLIVLGVRIPEWYEKFTNGLVGKGYLVTVRPHPSFPVKDKELQFCDDVKINRTGSFSDCLHNRPLCVVGEWSASLVEAGLAGVPAISIGSEGLEYFKDVGFVICLEDYPDALAKVLSLEDDPSLTGNAGGTNENLKDVVNEILGCDRSHLGDPAWEL